MIPIYLYLQFVEKGNEDGTIYNDMMNEKNGINGTYGDVQKY
jgi:hypothetical protein